MNKQADNTYAARLSIIMETYKDEIKRIGEFGVEEQGILKRIAEQAHDFSMAYAYEAAQLIMSWASDAQHDIAMFFGNNKGEEDWNRPEVKALNNLKRELIETVMAPYNNEYGRPNAEIVKMFQKEFTGNY